MFATATAAHALLWFFLAAMVISPESVQQNGLANSDVR